MGDQIVNKAWEMTHIIEVSMGIMMIILDCFVYGNFRKAGWIGHICGFWIMTNNEEQLIITVTLYHRSEDPQTRLVEEDLASIQPLTPHRVVKINVETDPILRERYYNSCPVVEVGPYLVNPPFKKTDLVATLGATHDTAQANDRNE